jgi:hypothetical protein
VVEVAVVGERQARTLPSGKGELVVVVPRTPNTVSVSLT